MVPQHQKKMMRTPIQATNPDLHISINIKTQAWVWHM
jgi:hypothetical protein